MPPAMIKSSLVSGFCASLYAKKNTKAKITKSYDRKIIRRQRPPQIARLFHHKSGKTAEWITGILARPPRVFIYSTSAEKRPMPRLAPNAGKPNLLTSEGRIRQRRLPIE